VIFERCEIADVIKITPKRHADDRGFFVELFRKDLFRAEVGNFDFVQYNQSLSRQAGTVRGLHYQVPPSAQGKLVRCLRGRLFDVAVDVRRSSPTYGRHVALEMSGDDDAQIWIPPGFAHGFCTLSPDTEIWYAVTSVYSPADERGLLWNDPDLAIAWPVQAAATTLSPRDTRLPGLRAAGADFE
jgi:dTDP-4-dehydrorhamnose 3,5-epimerase